MPPGSPGHGKQETDLSRELQQNRCVRKQAKVPHFYSDLLKLKELDIPLYAYDRNIGKLIKLDKDKVLECLESIMNDQ